jgi:hypothetical protein
MNKIAVQTLFEDHRDDVLLEGVTSAPAVTDHRG